MNCCPKCTFRIYWNDDHVLYSCGHKLHSACLLTTRWSLINPTCSICNIGDIVKYKCMKNERIISRNEKNKKNNDINDNDINDINDNDANGKEEIEEIEENIRSNVINSFKQEAVYEEKRLIITQILCVFLIAFAIWKIISM